MVLALVEMNVVDGSVIVTGIEEIVAAGKLVDPALGVPAAVAIVVDPEMVTGMPDEDAGSG